MKICIYLMTHGSEDPEAVVRSRVLAPDPTSRMPDLPIDEIEISDSGSWLSPNGLCLARATLEIPEPLEDRAVRFLQAAQGIGRISGFAILG